MTTTLPQTRAVLFVDISDSSRFFRELGDREASRQVKTLLARLGDEVRAESGVILDRIGDELLCTFRQVDQALRAAVLQQRTMLSLRLTTELAFPTAVRAGVHVGDVIESDGMLFGDCLNTAKRVVDSAKPEQILVSAQAKAAADATAFSFRLVDTTLLKGRLTRTQLYELMWNQKDATELQASARPGSEAGALRLQLCTANRELIVREGHVVTLGRVDTCQVVVPSPFVSKLHARIQGRKGRFLLQDVSTNGTFVVGNAAEGEQYVRRDQLLLREHGLIGLGKRPMPNAAHTLRFRYVH